MAIKYNFCILKTLWLTFYSYAFWFLNKMNNVISLVSFRSRLKRRLQNANDEEDKDRSEDIEEVIIEKDKGANCNKLAGVLGG